MHPAGLAHIAQRAILTNFVPTCDINISSKMEVPPTGSKAKEDNFSWTDGEIELLLECIKVYAATCRFEGLHWEGIRAKYDKI